MVLDYPDATFKLLSPAPKLAVQVGVGREAFLEPRGRVELQAVAGVEGRAIPIGTHLGHVHRFKTGHGRPQNAISPNIQPTVHKFLILSHVSLEDHMYF